MYCTQCYELAIEPRVDPNIPFSSIGRDDLFPEQVEEGCARLDYDPRLERIFRYQAAETGTVSFRPQQLASCSNSEYLTRFYLKSADLPCDITGWTYLGCWTHEDREFNQVAFPVEANQSYYILMDYYGTNCPARYSPSTQAVVEGEHCNNPCAPVSNLQVQPEGNGVVTIQWEGPPDAIGYDIVPASSGRNLSSFNRCARDERINQTGFTLHPNNSIRLNIDSLLTVFNATNIAYSIYVRARCAVDNYSTWQEVNVTPAISAKASYFTCLLYTSPSPRDRTRSRMPSSA